MFRYDLTQLNMFYVCDFELYVAILSLLHPVTTDDM